MVVKKRQSCTGSAGNLSTLPVGDMAFFKQMLAASKRREAIITLWDGRRVVLEEGWEFELGDAVNKSGEACSIALARPDGVRLTFVARMLSSRVSKRIR